jgi:putative heme-binding domain-containing protein
LLFERQDKGAGAPLRQLIKENPSPLARMHALWALEGLESLTQEDLLTGLSDQNAGVREHAVRLSESRLSGSKELLAKAAALAEDAEPRVRLQAALSLGDAPGPQSAQALARIARRDADDAWIRTAVLSSVGSSASDVLAAMIQEPQLSVSAKEFLRSLAALVGAKKGTDAVDAVFRSIESPKAPDVVAIHVLFGLAEGVRQSGGRLSDRIAKTKHQPAFQAVLNRAGDVAGNSEQSIDDRIAAVRLLGQRGFAEAQAAVLPLVSPQQPNAVQLAALRTLSEFSRPEAATALLANWRSFTPPLQMQVLETLFSRPVWSGALLDAVEQGTISPSQIPAVRVAQWRRSTDASFKSRVERVFAGADAGPRKEVIAKYKPALAQGGDVAKGKAVYERECRNCHRVGNDGWDVGPNLATIRNRTPESLIEQILDPNREVLPSFVEYAVSMDDGRLLTGIIASESPTSLTLKRAMGVEEVVLRRNIESIAATGKSLMPEGLEKKITPQELADLTAFLLRGPLAGK